jgi:hypothetical protein
MASRREVQDRETAVRQHNAARRVVPHASIIWAAMMQPLTHGHAKIGKLPLAEAVRSINSRYATHDNPDALIIFFKF